MASSSHLNVADLVHTSPPDGQMASSDAFSVKPSPPARKRTNTRPCDACAIRRVRCDLQSVATGSCTNCTNHQVKCTNVRIRHKSGPKKIKQKTRESIISLVSHSATIGATINCRTGEPAKALSLDQLLPFLQVYQTWYYCIWPVVSVAQLTSILNTKAVDSKQPLQLDEVAIAEAYVLSCSVCAAISRHKQFMTSTHVLNFDNYPTSLEYAREAERVSYEFDLRAVPSMNGLLANFFLHTYHSNVPNGSTKGVLYLRDAVTVAHMLGLHDPNFYVGKSNAIAHRYRKIYYQLLVAERFVSFECGIPVLLEPKIPIPSLEDEEYSDLLLGFTELAEVFSTTDRQFFEELHSKVFKSAENPADTNNVFQYSDLSMLQDFLQNQPSTVKKQWIFQLQKKLDRNIVNEKALLDSQKVNIFLSRSWIQSMGWLISSENYLVNPNSMSTADDCFSAKFPLKIANDFLTQTKGLPEYAFESNGPGVSFKLLEVADSLHHFTSLSTNHRDTSTAYDQLSTIFKMIVRFKNDMEMPRALFGKIADFLDMKQLNIRQPTMNSTTSDTSSVCSGSIELLDDNSDDFFGDSNSNQLTLTNIPDYNNGNNQGNTGDSHSSNDNNDEDESPKTQSLFSNFKNFSPLPYVDDLMKSPGFNNPFQPSSTTNPNEQITPTNTNLGNFPTPLAYMSPFYGISDI